jgi:integrase
VAKFGAGLRSVPEVCPVTGHDDQPAAGCDLGAARSPPQLCHADAANPIPRGAAAAARGERSRLLAHVNIRPKSRSRLRGARAPAAAAGLDRAEATALLESLPLAEPRSPSQILYSGLRSTGLLGLAMRDIDIGRRWVRVADRGDNERRVPVDADVAGPIPSYPLVERPKTEVTRCSWWPRANPGPAVDPGRVARCLPLPLCADRRGGRAPDAPRHSFGNTRQPAAVAAGGHGDVVGRDGRPVARGSPAPLRL